MTVYVRMYVGGHSGELQAAEEGGDTGKPETALPWSGEAYLH